MSIPTHVNSFRASQEFAWAGTDNQNRWEQNYQNPENRDFLDSVKHFRYRYNSHGFRTPEFDNGPCVIALGCSHTEGVGIAYEDIWTNVVEQETGSRVYNLGVLGIGIDGVYRLLRYYSKHLGVTGVCVNVPPATRFEINGYDQADQPWATYTVHDTAGHDFLKTWFLNDDNSELHQERAVGAIRWYCHQQNIPLALVYSNDEQYIDKSGPRSDLGRDLLHYGKGYQLNIGHAIIKQMRLW